MELRESSRLKLLHNAWMTCAALLLAIPSLVSAGDPVPRPKDLPASVPENAIITRWSDQPEGGLLKVAWGGKSMLWAEPCRSTSTALSFAQDEQRKYDCPMTLDMQVRPLYLGTLDLKATKKARKLKSATPCCYAFKTFGNR